MVIVLQSNLHPGWHIGSSVVGIVLLVNQCYETIDIIWVVFVYLCLLFLICIARTGWKFASNCSRIDLCENCSLFRNNFSSLKPILPVWDSSWCRCWWVGSDTFGLVWHWTRRRVCSEWNRHHQKTGRVFLCLKRGVRNHVLLLSFAELKYVLMPIK